MNGEGTVAGDRDFSTKNLGDADQRRGLGGKSSDKGFDRGRVAFDLDEDAARRVEDEADEGVAARKVIDVGAKADALHDAANL